MNFAVFFHGITNRSGSMVSNITADYNLLGYDKRPLFSRIYFRVTAKIREIVLSRSNHGIAPKVFSI